MGSIKLNILVFFISVGFLLNVRSGIGQDPQLGKDPVKRIINAMTLEEKANLVVGTGMRFSGAPSETANSPDQSIPAIGNTQDLVPGAAGTTSPVPRLGISPLVVADGPAGLRISPTRPDTSTTYYCTAFPVASLLASTWDPDLVRLVGQAMGSEALEYGVDIILGPGLNIHRNPLCGRNFEYFSEDPFVTGKMAAAMVNGIESKGVGTAPKHFAANNAETNRNSLNTIVSERALREIYLKGFGIMVEEAQPWTLMSSYNLINGTYAPESYDLLTKVLREDWGFSGFVMTDWFGGRDPIAMMNAGNDLLMPGNPNQNKAILEAAKAGALDVTVLNRNVERILKTILMSHRFNGYKYSNKPDLGTHAEVARQVSSDGMVLLKNDNSTLPLKDGIKRIAAFGNTSYDIITGGTGSGDVNEAYSIALVEGLENADLTVEENLRSLYEAYLKTAKAGRQRRRGFMMGSIPIGELAINSDIVSSVVNLSDAAIITIGRNSGEGYDRSEDEGDFLLTTAEKDLIRTVTSVYHEKDKKVIVILNVGGVVETATWKDHPDAILLAWQAGQETGNSIADILVGKVNPSGKLASTFPVYYKDVPSAANFPGNLIRKVQKQSDAEQGLMASFMSPRPTEVRYEEGIFVGYRYYTTFNIPVSYEFGYGLSYTTFDYSNIRISSQGFSNRITVTLEIRNSGKTDGKEIVQLYLTAPRQKLDKPLMELKGFKKTQLLKPGESEVVSFVISKMDLASFNPELSAWLAEKGTYAVKIGSSSGDIRQTATFNLRNDLIVKKETQALQLQEKINELKSGK